MYQKIALAIAFSPRMEALIAEAKRLIDLFGSELILIHVGLKTADLEAKLSEIITTHGLNTASVTTIWKEGKPAKMILKACEEENVDLLMLGALKKEGLLTYYLGSVARKVIRKAKCSVLTLIDPKIDPTKFSKVVINGTQLEVTPKVISQGLKFCQIEGTTHVHIINEIKLYGLQMATAGEGSEDEVSNTRRKLVQEEIRYVQEILNGLDQSGLKINIKVTAGKWAVELVRYCESISADLLIMGDENGYTFIDRLFPHDLEEILSELPCNLLIVK
ncbi:Nucleotide-binding universal stress protein, UspA family [Algoriphagus alkaliphilus]|uniref:Nucleotide-binding universal stress protein, UspA family n=1 Tax=Algoriphagus alkaliphilus TaxID=279824 RepID=A0A1G5WP45_9BACT|nr:universal stress protein [Algoriphagus alkaliphilus]SDA59961.1 Nucleotide-binding universal stress protein, UspA family [Algoriphagus alkaliphilus]